MDLTKSNDLQTIWVKLPGFPWAKYSGEKYLPKHNYIGLNTRFDIRFDENNILNPTVLETIGRAFVKNIMKAKIVFGASLSDREARTLSDELH